MRSVGGGSVHLRRKSRSRPSRYLYERKRAGGQTTRFQIQDTFGNLIVVYDDYDLPKGHIRIRASGSAGTHNGMRSIIGELGTGEFARVRVGIRDEEVDIPIIHYVLSNVRREDYPLFAKACSNAAEACIAFASGKGIEQVMSEYNGK